MKKNAYTIVSNAEASKVNGGYRTYASKAGCESREGKGKCTYRSKADDWVGGGVYSSNGK